MLCAHTACDSKVTASVKGIQHMFRVKVTKVNIEGRRGMHLRACVKE